MPDFVLPKAFKDRSTPFLLLETSSIKRNYLRLKRALKGGCAVYFSVKANNHPMVLSTIAAMGGGFDVASTQEIRDALSHGVAPSEMAFSNPMKRRSDISFAHANGLRLFAADSKDEIDKLAELAPKSEVYVRLSVGNAGSGWPLASKFGVSEKEALALLLRARDAGLRPSGLTFHVGSQCVNTENWKNALAACARVWSAARKKGLPLDLLDLGGGIPAPYAPVTVPVEEIAVIIRSGLRGFPGLKRAIIEPGRYLVAESGTLVATVIGMAKRRSRRLAFLDVGLFNGLMEAYEKFWHPIEVIGAGAGKKEKVTLVGPTCDSVDTIVADVLLPALSMGDKIAFRHAGAYTNSYETYNGYDYPECVVVD